jgi:hypothetical protein
MNWTTFFSIVPVLLAVIGYLVWAVKQQAGQSAKVDRNTAAREEDDVRRRMLEDEERVRKLIASELDKFQLKFGTFLDGTFARTKDTDAKFATLEKHTEEVSNFLTAQDSNGRGLRAVIRHEITDILQIQGAH